MSDTVIYWKYLIFSMRTVDEENVFVKISYRLCHIDYKIVSDD